MIEFNEKGFTDFAEDLKKLSVSIDNIERIFSPGYFGENIWPKLRVKIVEFLKENLKNIKEIPVTPRWTDTKKILVRNPPIEYPRILQERGYLDYTTARSGDTWLQAVSSDNWKLTGTMENTINSELDSWKGNVEQSENNLQVSIDVDISQLNDLYPNIVDERLMEASGGNIGIMRLLVHQQNEIYKMLMTETGNLSEEIFKGNK